MSPKVAPFLQIPEKELFDDVYGVMMVPKELEVEKEAGFEFVGQVQHAEDADFMRTREDGEFLSGALAGAMTTAVLAPLEAIRARMVVGVGSRNIAGSFIEIVEQCWQGLWAGNTINMPWTIPTQAIELGTFECVKRTMISVQEKWSLQDPLKLQIGVIRFNLSFSWISPVAVGGAAAGIVSTLVCHPLEVLKIETC